MMRLVEAQRLGGLMVVVVWFALACGEGVVTAERAAGEHAAPASGPAITIGDIDPCEPAKRIRRLQPLADWLGARLKAHGIERGRVVVARSIDEMAELLRAGEVDLLFDSPLPVLAARRVSGGKVLLRRAAGGDFEYWSVFIGQRGGAVKEVEDLEGRVLALQERHSTSGYLLPMITLGQAGFVVEQVEGPSSTVRPDRIGVFFSGDEENTVEMIRSGLADAGVISNREFDDLPPDYRREMTQFARTPSVPRQLVLARRGLDPELLATVETVLLGLTDENREQMAAEDPELGWTWIFDCVDTEAIDVLAELERFLSSEGHV